MAVDLCVLLGFFGLDGAQASDQNLDGERETFHHFSADSLVNFLGYSGVGVGAGGG